MDGTLFIWYGPFQRWQKRYVALNNGKLNIYFSKDSNSHLESLYLAAANVSPEANSQLEWIIQAPGKSSVYFKVSEPEERRRWLKLIGSVKACISDSSVLMEGEHHTPPTGSDYSRLASRSYEPHQCTDIPSMKPSSPQSIEQDSVTSKRQSRGSCDLEDELNQSVLSCVKMIQSLCKELKSEVSKLQVHCMQGREHDVIRYWQFDEDISSLLTDIKDTIGSVTSQTRCCEALNEYNGDTTKGQGTIDTTTDISPEPNDSIATFFTGIEVSFTSVMQEAMGDPEPTLLCSVHSQTFIDACINHAKFFDLFAATLFSPLRNDILSNAQKVRRAFRRDSRRYVYLQLIFEDEIRKKQHVHPDSACQAVVWIMRGLRTVSRFLTIVCSRGHPHYKNTSQALGSAYQEHLSRHHNFIVQKMFSAGIRLLPSIDHFKKQIITDKNLDVSSEVIEDHILQQTTAYSKSIMEVVQAIEKVFMHHELDL